MNLTPIEFLQALKEGKTEYELNRTSTLYVDPKELKKLTSKRYGHTIESAKEHLTTDFTHGFTICSKCGSYHLLGRGFTKHLSNGCIICEGQSKHHCYWVNETKVRGSVVFPRREMCVAFDDGLHYTKSQLEACKYEDYI